MKGIFSVLVENKAGVLSKTAGLFARRGFNIDSLAVGETDDRDISSMTIISTGDERIMEQIEKPVADLVDEGEEQVVLILEILVKAAARDARGLHNAVDGRLGVGHGGKFAPRALQNARSLLLRQAEKGIGRHRHLLYDKLS